MNKNFTKSAFVLAITLVIASTSFANVYGYGSSSHGGGRIIRTTPAPLVLGAATTTVLASTSTTPACSGMLLNTYMKIGNANNADQVKKLQTFLTEQGFAVPSTGFFGPITEGAVKSFQTKYANEVLTPWNLTTPTGYVFKTTRAKINNLVCAGSETMPSLTN